MLSIEILHLDVFEVQAEALVNPANRQPSFLFGSHVNERIRKKCGKEVIEERKRKGPIKLGEAVFTRGGNLPFKYIIHAAVLDMFDMNPLFLLRLKQRTDSSTLKNATRNSMLIAKELRIKSVVFTPMGAGIGGMAMEKCAKIMLPEIIRFSKDNPDHLLEKVKFAIVSRKAENIFQKVLEGFKGA